MSEFCYQFIEFKCSSDDEFKKLINHLIAPGYRYSLDFNDMEKCGRLIEKHIVIEDMVDVQVEFQTKYQFYMSCSVLDYPETDFFFSDFFYNSNIVIDGWAENASNDTYITYHRNYDKKSEFIIEEYGDDILGKLKFYKEIGEDSESVFNTLFKHAYELGDIIDKYLDLTDPDIYEQELNNFTNKKFNYMSIIILDNDYDLMYDLSECDIEAILDATDPETYDILFQDESMCFTFLHEYKKIYGVINTRITSEYEKYLKAGLCKCILLAKYICLYDDKIKKSREIYDLTDGDIKILKHIPDEYLDRRLLMEKKLFV